MEIFNPTIDLLESGCEIGIDVIILPEDESYNYIQKCLDKFKPVSVGGHLFIGKNSIALPIEPYEFTYSEYLIGEPGYIFLSRPVRWKKEQSLKYTISGKLADYLGILMLLVIFYRMKIWTI